MKSLLNKKIITSAEAVSRLQELCDNYPTIDDVEALLADSYDGPISEDDAEALMQEYEMLVDITRYGERHIHNWGSEQIELIKDSHFCDFLKQNLPVWFDEVWENMKEVFAVDWLKTEVMWLDQYYTAINTPDCQWYVHNDQTDGTKQERR